MKKDRVFRKSRTPNEAFSFNRETADVFDDMLNRSVPFYAETQKMIIEIARNFVQPKSSIYDLGCSTGATLIGLCGAIADKSVKITGVDYSAAMLEKTRKNLGKFGYGDRCILKNADLNDGIKINNASVVIMNLTLQFVRPLNRDRLIKTIYRGLKNNGCFVLVEKVLGNNSVFNRTFINLYYDFKKRQGYSKLEIAQKREALENVLVPYRLYENLDLLEKNSFRDVDIFFKWYNFCGILALKLRN